MRVRYVVEGWVWVYVTSFTTINFRDCMVDDSMHTETELYRGIDHKNNSYYGFQYIHA